ncbi:carbonic anhydrase [Meiothermus sp.]|jgi:carbonic anhydrase|uniref:carbonic anhydrase n=1 Tax=Meiothermus sp. TaxID=1955249 RepID=UPI0021DBB056|nr:carbonic anhydrase [Meiothermus sp.]GIW24074.1 MAG: carbonic anhydrase [Meiothermus sp.]
MLPEPVYTLLRSHNEGLSFPPFSHPELAVVTCMDFRIHLRMPENFAFVLRTGGANPEPVEPYLAFSVARMGIQAIALIGHTDCAMQYPDPYVLNHLPTDEEHIRHYRAQIAALAIGEVELFTRRQARKLSVRLGLPVVPLLYRVEDHRLQHLDTTLPEYPSRLMGLERSL